MGAMIAKHDIDTGVITTFDEQKGRIPINEWLSLYYKKTGVELNAGTVRKRRMVSGLGQLVPPRTYILTREEFLEVLQTPLPMCANVVKNPIPGIEDFKKV